MNLVTKVGRGFLVGAFLGIVLVAVFVPHASPRSVFVALLICGGIGMLVPVALNPSEKFMKTQKPPS